MKKLVATIPKSARDEIRAALAEFSAKYSVPSDDLKDRGQVPAPASKIAAPLIADDTQTMPPQNTPSPSAIRMRRYRERRDRRAVVISLEVDSDTLDALVDHGFLAEADVESRVKVCDAVDILLFALFDGAIEIDREKYD